MTLIIGGRCANGIVIGSDRKEMRGGEATFGNKIFEQGGVVLAIEGLTGIRDDFLLLLDYEIKRERGFTSLYQAKVVIEDIISNLSERYAERIGEEGGSIGVLMGGLTEIGQGRAQLYYIHGVGYGEAVNFMCRGHGGPYALSLAKFLYDPSAQVDEIAYRFAFVISWISDEVDVTVGGTPQIAIIKDTKPKVEYLSNDFVEDAIRRSREAKKELVSSP